MNKTSKLIKNSTKTQKPKGHKTDGNKCDHENSNKLQTILKNRSDEEYYNFSDSSLELFDSFKPRPQKKSVKKKVKTNVIFDQIDLTNGHIKSHSSESFKSIKSVLSDTNNENNCDHGLNNSPVRKMFNKNIFKLNENEVNNKENNYSTPKEKNILIDHLSTSAKQLDNIYGKEWRHVDGVLEHVNQKKFNDDLYSSDSDGHEDIENSFSCDIPRSQCLPDNDVETLIIFEKFNLSNNADHNHHKNSSDNSNYECKNLESDNNVKQVTKFKTSKKDNNIKKEHLKLKDISKTPIEAYTEGKLSFLSSLSCHTGSLKCDSEAEKYKFKFKKNKDELLAVLFKMFNDEVFDSKLPTNMNFKWNARLRSTAGACFNKRTVKIVANLDCERVSRIELSSKIIDTAERLRDTLIHELCHAACWIFDGISEGHGPFWKKWANKAMEKYPELPVIKRCHSYDVQTKFTYKCIKCGYSFGRHSKSLNLEKKRCGYCYGEFELIVNKTNKNPLPSNKLPVVYSDPINELYNLNYVQTKTKLPKKPSKFALFVKENYGQVKRENPSSKHGEVMKLLGSRFATTKILTPDEVFDQLFDS